jgi:hypothetical protein
LMISAIVYVIEYEFEQEIQMSWSQSVKLT